jgi:hypothetical protein
VTRQVWLRIIYFTQINLAIGLTTKLQPCFNYIIHDSSFGRVCDRERIQPLIELALSATSEERRRRMEELANIMKEDVQRMTLMDTFVIYGMVEDLKWEPRPDQAVLGAL